MESEMPLNQMTLAGEPRLRVVFGTKPVAMGLPAGSTLGDIAEWVGDVARSHNGPVRSIAIKTPRVTPLRLCRCAPNC
jgi:hypothetical protein